MKKFFILSLILIFSLGLVYAQKGPHNNVVNKNFQEFQTKVIAVEYAIPATNMNNMNKNNPMLKPRVNIRVLNKVDNKEVKIMLAPQDYLLMNNFSLKQGDEIKIKVEKMTDVNGNVKYLAYVVNKIVAVGDSKQIRTLRLRDEFGKPLWRKNIEQNEYSGHKTKK